MNELLTKEGDKKLLLLGNEAIVRGALEAGVGFASTYPGTPSSEIADTFHKLNRDTKLYFEYSTNEKVALEIAAGAAHSGVRTICSMKHVGLNVAADAFMTLLYTGSKAGFLIVSAGDPSMHSSQNEQDNRYYAKMSGAPMLEPSTPQEAKEMTRIAFDLSEELGLPFLFRTTTRLNHTTGIVDILPLPDPKTRGHFEKDPQRFVMVPGHARIAHPRLLKILEKATEMSENSPFNRLEGPKDARWGVVTSGISYTYVKEELKELGLANRVKVLKLGMTNPLPEKKIASFLLGLEKVIVVEELEPYLEETVKKICYNEDFKVLVFGKDSGHFSRLFEYTPTIVKEGFMKIFGVSDPRDQLVCERVSCSDVSEIPAPPRPPVLCPGCPHRATYYAAKKVVGKPDGVIWSNDIGCYTLGVQAPLKAADAILCMGGSVGMAGGFATGSDQKVIAVIGDSTFFASGIPAMINAVHHNHKFVLAILDNSTTAMTGHQPHPGIKGGPGLRPVSIPKLVEGCGVDFIKTIDPFDMEETKQAFKDALAHDGFAVVIAKSPCAILNDRAKRRSGIKMDQYYVDQDVCTRCKVCINTYGCPSFYLKKSEDGGKDRIFINPTLCDGCGGCPQVCPFDAIKKVEDKEEN